MKSSSLYSETPDLLTAYAPEYHKEHYHLHGRNIDNWEALKSVFLDQHYQVNVFARKVLKGAAVGLFYGFTASQFIWRGPKSFEMDRIILRKPWHFLSMRGYTAFGAVMGAAWYVIRDVICLPHGQDTYYRHLMAYGLMGAVLMGTIYHPVNSIYGFIAGAIFGGIYLNIQLEPLPRGFELKMKNVDQAKRARLLREDQQFEMSHRNVLHTRTNLYPL